MSTPAFGERPLPVTPSPHSHDRWREHLLSGSRRAGSTRAAISARLSNVLAHVHPERISGLIVQNGNAYEEGLKEFWDPIKAYQTDGSPAPTAQGVVAITVQGLGEPFGEPFSDGTFFSDGTGWLPAA